MSSPKVRSLVDQGFGGTLVDIECYISNNLPIIIGIADKAVDEAKERPRGAFTNSRFNLPRKRITNNLAPADIPKDSSSFDLIIAVAILRASGQISIKDVIAESVIFGELGLDGSVRSVRGIIGKILAAKALGITQFIVPFGNLQQAQLIPGVRLIAITSLSEFYQAATMGSFGIIETGSGLETDEQYMPEPELDFSEIVGQAMAKRALEIAAAGQHNVLLSGAPGTDKSMLAKALPGLQPPLTREEMLVVDTPTFIGS